MAPTGAKHQLGAGVTPSACGNPVGHNCHRSFETWVHKPGFIPARTRQPGFGACAVLVVTDVDIAMHKTPSNWLAAHTSHTSQLAQRWLPDVPGIWEVSRRTWDLGSLQTDLGSGRFPEVPGVWGVCRRTWDWRSLQTYLGFGEFADVPGIWGVRRRTWALGGFQTHLGSGKFPEGLSRSCVHSCR